MKRLVTTIFIIILLLASTKVEAQVPTAQDCMGAIPVCQFTYDQTNSFSGEGNYTNEINDNGDCPGSCLGSGEKNDVWYIFTIQTSGNLKFNITPNNSSDDYDWAVYNLTNHNCNNIYSNTSLQVSCNYSSETGTTGANGGSSSNCGGASDDNDNAAIPVTAGQTYVLNLSNFSETQYGYKLDFSNSTASIFDNISPVFQSVNLPIDCGATSMTFNFSENVMCNSVSTNDFTLTGPDGSTHTITSITGAGCASGGEMENTYTITVSPAITNSGTYELCLTNTAGSVEDACGNLAAPACFEFSILNISTNFTNVVDASCNAGGEATIVASGGTGNYTYTWNTNPTQTTATATELNGGTYTVTVSDGSCSAVNSVTIGDSGGPQSTATGTDDHCNQGIGTASVTAIGGSGTYTYTWDTNPVQTTSTVNGLTAGTYSVTVSDGSECPSVSTVTINNIAGPTLTFVSSTPETYGDADGKGTVSTNGGTQPIDVIWLTSPNQHGNTATGLSYGSYTVIATDASNCSDTIIVEIGLISSTSLSTTSTSSHCGHPDGTARVIVSKPVGDYTISWNTNPPQNTSYITNLSPGHYEVTVIDSLGTYQAIATVNNAPGPQASFIPSPNPSTIGDGPINFINTTVGANWWFWDFGDGNTSEEEFPSNTYAEVGEYLATLQVKDSYDCKDSLSRRIIINDIFTIYIPSAFSPNGDGINDYFTPEGVSIKVETFVMRIYDRWGKMVFKTTDYNTPWDGSINGKHIREKSSAIYSYEIELKDFKGLKHKYFGNVTLIY